MDMKPNPRKRTFDEYESGFTNNHKNEHATFEVFKDIFRNGNVIKLNDISYGFTPSITLQSFTERELNDFTYNFMKENGMRGGSKKWEKTNTYKKICSNPSIKILNKRFKFGKRKTCKCFKNGKKMKCSKYKWIK